jgi:hypothetical protein
MRERRQRETVATLISEDHTNPDTNPKDLDY